MNKFEIDNDKYFKRFNVHKNKLNALRWTNGVIIISLSFDIRIKNDK